MQVILHLVTICLRQLSREIGIGINYMLSLYWIFVSKIRRENAFNYVIVKSYAKDEKLRKDEIVQNIVIVSL